MAISEGAYAKAANKLRCDVAAIKAVALVESAGSGFNPDSTPKTLFEGHWFDRYTKGKFRSANPMISYPKWTRQFYGKTWQQEKERLELATRLDRNAALMSTSWGMFQIMGFHYAKCGFKTVQQFVNAMYKSEDSQLDIFVEFIIQSSLDDELRELRFADFARLYNGPSYKVNQYDKKMQAAYDKFKKAATP